MEVTDLKLVNFYFVLTSISLPPPPAGASLAAHKRLPCFFTNFPFLTTILYSSYLLIYSPPKHSNSLPLSFSLQHLIAFN